MPFFFIRDTLSVFLSHGDSSLEGCSAVTWEVRNRGDSSSAEEQDSSYEYGETELREEMRETATWNLPNGINNLYVVILVVWDYPWAE